MSPRFTWTAGHLQTSSIDDKQRHQSTAPRSTNIRILGWEWIGAIGSVPAGPPTGELQPQPQLPHSLGQEWSDGVFPKLGGMAGDRGHKNICPTSGNVSFKSQRHLLLDRVFACCMCPPPTLTGLISTLRNLTSTRVGSFAVHRLSTTGKE